MKPTYPAYRWFVEAMIILATMAQMTVWMAPAPLFPVMIPDLGISMYKAGLIVSTVSLCVVVFSLLGGLITTHLGLKNTLMIGLWMLGVGGIITASIHHYGSLLLVRILQGIGYGMVLPVLTALVMRWFPPPEKPYMNMLNTAFIHVGFIIVYTLTVPIFNLTSSWRTPFLVYGAYTCMVALLWSILGQERPGILNTASADKPRTLESSGTVREVFRIKDIRLLSLSYLFAFWVWQVFATFLPTYYVRAYGMDMEKASTTVGLLPIMAIFGAVLGGIGTGKVGLRKPFMWPLQLISIVGCLGAITTTGTLMRISLALMGLGSAGWLTALFTIPMELPGMNAVKVGIATALIRGLGYTGTFLSPVVGGWLAESVGLFAMLFAFAFLRLIPAVATMLVSETGPKVRKPIPATGQAEDVR